MQRITEQDEFLLSRLLDRDLTDREEVALRERMNREPELRRAFSQLSRLDVLLAGRRSETPRVDWSLLHRDIMDSVAAERQPATIKLSRWLGITVPFAAAAVIALAVLLQHRVTTITPAPSPVAIKPPGVRPAPVPGGAPTQGESRLVVQYNRPDSAGGDGEVLVSYARSTALAQETAEYDQEQQNRPSWHAFVADVTRPRPSGETAAETSPL